MAEETCVRITNNSPVTMAFFAIAALVSCLPMSPALLAVHGPITLTPGYLLSLFTYTFAHSDIRHFGGNLSMILLLGPILEERHGRRTFLLMLVSTMLAIGLIHSAFFSTGIIGASGIVFLCVTAVSVSSAKAGEIPLTLIAVCLAFLGSEIMQAVVSHDQIAHSAHLLGGVMGVAFGLAKRRRTGRKGR
jgi:membrane associated rhomboid family serine protease